MGEKIRTAWQVNNRDTGTMRVVYLADDEDPTDLAPNEIMCPQFYDRHSPRFVTKDSGAKDTFSTGYQRDCSAGKGAHDQLPFFALTRDAALYERGAMKYGPSNWMKGAPFSRTMQSAIRHLFQYMMGDRSEDHLAACRWGCAAVMTYEAMIAKGLLPADLDDLPRFTPHTSPTNPA